MAVEEYTMDLESTALCNLELARDKIYVFFRFLLQDPVEQPLVLMI